MRRKTATISRMPVAVMLAISSLLVIAIAYLSYDASRARAEAARQVAISREVHDATSKLLSTMKDAETGQRGFIITGSDAYLNPHQVAAVAIPGLLDRLDLAALERPDQAARLAELKPLVQDKLRELARTIEARRIRGFAAAQEIVDTNEGKVLMDRLRVASEGIQQVAQERIVRFSGDADDSARRLDVVSILGALVLLGFLGLSSRTIFDGLRLRDQLYQETASSAELLRVTLASIGDGVIATDASARITFINPIAQKLTGWTSEQAAGHPISQVFHIVNETSRALVDNPLEKALATGSVVGLANHTILIAKGGKEVPIDDSGAPIRDGSNGILGAVLVFRDISDRHRKDRQIREANDQLQWFVASAAHDLRAPLRTVNNFAQLLTRRFPQEAGAEGAQEAAFITQGIRKMERLLEDLLTFARASNFDAAEVEPASMEAALQTVLDTFRPDIEESKTVVTAAPLPQVRVQQSHLVQLFQNLIGNALKYRGADPPQIRIEAEQQQEMWRIKVSDNGIGIEPIFLKEIFVPFKRLHSDQHPGSGIGLATCAKIVAGYGGEIWVESQPGEGSTFFFTLPRG